MNMPFFGCKGRVLTGFDPYPLMKDKNSDVPENGHQKAGSRFPFSVLK